MLCDCTGVLISP